MLAALRIIKARQRSRLIWIRCGDANTKLFQLRANSRRRKNFIAHLNVQGRTVTQHDDKATTLLHHFQSLLGTYSTRTASINWDSLPLPTHDLHSLDDPLTEAEIQNIIMQLPTESLHCLARTDSHVYFLKKAWNIIKEDVLAALQQMFALQTERLGLLNTCKHCLTPKGGGSRQCN
jgi:predicted alpha/beta-fold hydrolase